MDESKNKMYAVAAEPVELVEANDFSKHYKQGEVHLYVAKAFDEKTSKHYLVCSVPDIPSLRVHKIQLPMEFDKEEDRNAVFATFDAEDFLKRLKEQIIENKKLSEEKK